MDQTGSSNDIIQCCASTVPGTWSPPETIRQVDACSGHVNYGARHLLNQPASDAPQEGVEVLPRNRQHLQYSLKVGSSP